MTEKTSLLDDLISAYETTNFHVKAEPPFILNVGKPSKELKTLFKQNNVTSAAFITAWNPYSKSLLDFPRFSRQLIMSEITKRKLNERHQIYRRV